MELIFEVLLPFIGRLLGYLFIELFLHGLLRLLPWFNPLYDCTFMPPHRTGARQLYLFRKLSLGNLQVNSWARQPCYFLYFPQSQNFTAHFTSPFLCIAALCYAQKRIKQWNIRTDPEELLSRRKTVRRNSPAIQYIEKMYFTPWTVFEGYG